VQEEILTAPVLVFDKTGDVQDHKNKRYIYKGPPTLGVFQYARCFKSEMRHAEIVVDAPGVEAGVLVTNLPGESPEGRVSSGNVFEDVRVMHAGSEYAPKKAFSIDNYILGGGDNNNENHNFIRCFAHSYTEAGYHVSGHQSMNHVFDRCHAWDGGGRKPVGWWFEKCTYFTARNCGGTLNRIDFLFGWPSIRAGIYNFDSEHAKQFLVTDRILSGFTLSVDGLRWDGEPEVGVPVIDAFGYGPFDIRNANFGALNDRTIILRFAGGAEADVTLWGMQIQQYGESPLTEAPIQMPAGWVPSTYGLRYEWIAPDGSRVRRPITVNDLPTSVVE
jgi:hypothetical protein